MPTSQPQAPVDICNLALDLMKELPITSIEAPKNDTERIMARWYDHVRRVCLREYTWNCAQGYEDVPRAGDGKAGYADRYDYPNDCIRINSLGEDLDDPITDFQVFGRQIHVDNGGAALPLWFNRNLTHVSQMDDLFVGIFALRLALKTAMKITGKKATVELLEMQLQREEPKAISVDGQERPPVRIERSKYLAARKRGGYGGRSHDNRYYE